MPSFEDKKRAYDETVRTERDINRRNGDDHATADRKARESAARAAERNERRGWARRKDS